MDSKSLSEAFDRMAGHFEASGVDLASDNLQLGVPDAGKRSPARKSVRE